MHPPSQKQMGSKGPVVFGESAGDYRPVPQQGISLLRPGDSEKPGLLGTDVFHLSGKRMSVFDYPGFIKGKLCLTNPVSFCDGVIITVNEEGLASSIWTSVRPLTWSYMTSLSLHWRERDLKGKLFGG